MRSGHGSTFYSLPQATSPLWTLCVSVCVSVLVHVFKQAFIDPVLHLYIFTEQMCVPPWRPVCVHFYLCACLPVYESRRSLCASEFNVVLHWDPFLTNTLYMISMLPPYRQTQTSVCYKPVPLCLLLALSVSFFCTLLPITSLLHRHWLFIHS